MAPTPSAGRSMETPKTPTRIGRTVESNSTSKMTPKDTAKSTTPRKPPKLGAPKSAAKKQESAGKTLSSLPPPQHVQQSNSKDTKENAESSADDLSSEPYHKIGMKDNDLEPTAGKGGHLREAYDDDGQSTSVADTSELDSADPKPIADEDESEAEHGGESNTVTDGAHEHVNDAARDLGSGIEDEKDTVNKEDLDSDAAEEAEDESEKAGALSGIRSAAGGLTNGVKKLGGKATGGVKNTVKDATGKASKGDVKGVASDTAGNLQDTATGTAGDVKDTVQNTASGVKDTAQGAYEDVPKNTGDVKNMPDKAKKATGDVKNITENTSADVEDLGSQTAGDVKDTAEGLTDQAGGTDNAKDAVEDVAGQAKDKTQDDQDATSQLGNQLTDKAGDAKEKLSDLGDQVTENVPKARETAEDLSDQERDPVESTKDTALQAATGTQEATQDGTGDIKKSAENLSDQVQQGVEGAKDEVDERVDSGTEDITDSIKDASGLDLSALKGLKVEENGDIIGKDGKVLGRLDEGDPADLEGYEVGDEGEILDEDGDVVGRASLVHDQAKDLSDTAHSGAKQLQDTAENAVDQAKDTAEDAAQTYLPDIEILDGLEVQENGDILDKDGNALGRITEGDPADLVGMTLNRDGEILDEDGDVVGRAETLPQEVKEQAEHATDDLPGLDSLEGLEVSPDGAIKDDNGNTLGRITEGDPEDLVGRPLNADGEVLDEDGDVIGRAEVVQEAAEAANQGKDLAQELSPEVQRLQDLEEQLKPNLDIVEGRKLNKKGNILDDEGDVLAKLVEGDAKTCAGKLPNENGEIVDEEGNVIGRVEVVPGEAAEEAMRQAHPTLVEQLEEAQQAAKDAEEEVKDSEEVSTPDFSILEGLKVNKKGDVLNEDGEPVGRLAEGYDLDDVRGKKINENGEILDKDGNVLGKVDLIDQAADQAEENLPTSVLEGLKVNKKGEVLNEDGDVIARLSEGELDDVKGQKLNGKGEVLDKKGNIMGKVELTGSADGDVNQDQADEDDDLPPLSTLQGLKVNKSGKMIDNDGNIVGELVEGDAKKLWKSGLTADEEGQFWDNKGHVIGRAKTLPKEDESSEAIFAGLDSLVVVKGGFVEDENGNRVGVITEGDPKKLVGRAVDEDGDILDKNGNVVGHADRYEEEEQKEQPPADLSELKGLTPNKQGNVVGHDGVPVGRVVEGNVKELAGRKIDEEGQIWNDQGKVIGRCELIQPEEREAKPEGPFAGLDGLVVVEEGLVHDSKGNVVGKLVDGDPKKCIGRGVDEDGDIVDKYGNVKGHAEPYEPPEEVEEAPEDLSSLAGKTVNKQGKVVDEHGTIFGQVTEGDVKRLVGCKVDEKGQIWSNAGKVIGKAGLIQGGDDGRAEGPFSNFDEVTVAKDGTVKTPVGETVGRVAEGEIKKLVGRRVDADGDIVDRNGNVIGKAERWEPAEKEREVSPMAGLRINKEGEVRDKNGDIIGGLTAGNLLSCVGREINDNGYVVDQDGNKIGECTLLENIQDEKAGPSEEEVREAEEKEVANKIASILQQTIEKMEPICKQIDDHIEKADRTPREELDEQKLVDQVKPLIEDGSRILSECNGSIRGLDPDGHIASNAKAKAASGEASPEQYRVAEGLKELTGTIVKCIDNAKKKISDMPHAKKKLSPLWALLTEPLFQIIAAVGLLLSGVLGLVGKLLNGLGLGGILNGILGGLGVDKMLDGLGLGTVTDSLGLGGGKKK